MHCYRDLRITSQSLDEKAIIEFVELFAQSTLGWTFPKEKSREYSTLCGVPSCCLIHEPTALPRAAIHLTQYKFNREPSGVYVPNIIPLDSSSLSEPEYNGIALQFARALRACARHEKSSIGILLSKPTKRLHDIIGGKVTRRLFRRYVRLFPESSHPNDLARLDAFTCAISRYSKRHFDVDAFEHLLCEELGWSGQLASRCRNRVEIGLAVLAANRAFNPQ